MSATSASDKRGAVPQRIDVGHQPVAIVGARRAVAERVDGGDPLTVDTLYVACAIAKGIDVDQYTVHRIVDSGAAIAKRVFDRRSLAVLVGVARAAPSGFMSANPLTSRIEDGRRALAERFLNRT